MGMEAIKSAGLAYQGSVSSAAQTESQPRVEAAVNAGISDALTSNAATETKSAGESAETGAQQNTDARNAQIKKAVEEVNKKAVNSEAIFGIHEETNRVTIKIIDKESKKVIKEIPPEKTLDMIAKVWELAGLMVDEKR